jgi:hypothetical protein
MSEHEHEHISEGFGVLSSGALYEHYARDDGIPDYLAKKECLLVDGMDVIGAMFCADEDSTEEVPAIGISFFQMCECHGREETPMYMIPVADAESLLQTLAIVIEQVKAM